MIIFQSRYPSVFAGWKPDAPDQSGSAALVKFEPAPTELGVERINLVGHSLGTVIALSFVNLYPERVATLTLASPSSGHANLDEAERARLREGRLGDLAMLGPRGMAEKRGPRLLGPHATEEQRRAVIETMSLVHPEGYSQAVWMLSGADTRSDLARLPQDMRVQFIYGDADVVTTPESILAVAAARPTAARHVLSGTGHALYIERPGAFNDLLRTFIAVNLA